MMPAKVVTPIAEKVGRPDPRPSVAWQPREGLGRKEWIIVGRRLGGIGRCNQWWLGDWVRYGNEKWGQKYTVASKITGDDPWLNRAVAEKLSVADLRTELRVWQKHVGDGDALTDEESTMDREEGEIACPKCGYRMSVLA
jgi:hypothetical protein